MPDELSTSGTPAPETTPAPSQTEPAQTPEASPARPQTAEPSDADPLSADERAALNAIKDPDERIKGFQSAYTKRFQDLAEARKGISEWQPLVDAFKADPVATVRALASQMGLNVADPKVEAVKDTAKDFGSQIDAALRDSLGPEYGDLADRIVPGFTRAVELAIQQHTAPLRQEQEKLIQDSALREAQTTLDSFGKSHPDWKQHEPAMMKLAEKLQPGPGMPEHEWLEALYTLSTLDQRTADKTKETIARMTKAAATADTATTTLAGDKVTTKPNRPVTMREAYEAAKRGERFE